MDGASAARAWAALSSAIDGGTFVAVSDPGSGVYGGATGCCCAEYEGGAA